MHARSSNLGFCFVVLFGVTAAGLLAISCGTNDDDDHGGGAGATAGAGGSPRGGSGGGSAGAGGSAGGATAGATAGSTGSAGSAGGLAGNTAGSHGDAGVSRDGALPLPADGGFGPPACPANAAGQACAVASRPFGDVCQLASSDDRPAAVCFCANGTWMCPNGGATPDGGFGAGPPACPDMAQGKACTQPFAFCRAGQMGGCICTAEKTWQCQR